MLAEQLSIVVRVVVLLGCLCPFYSGAGESQPQPVVYRNRDLGWVVDIPAGWRVMKETEARSIRASGRRYVQKLEGRNGSASRAADPVIDALWIERDPLNNFTATYFRPPIPFRSQEDVAQTAKKAERLAQQMYRDKGATFKTSFTKKKIGKIVFYVYGDSISLPGHGYVFSQVAYTGYVRRYLLTITIMYSKKGYGDSLRRMAESSRFITKLEQKRGRK